jgi:hypothetical protein
MTASSQRSEPNQTKPESTPFSLVFANHVLTAAQVNFGPEGTLVSPVNRRRPRQNVYIRLYSYRTPVYLTIYSAADVLFAVRP